MDGRGQRCPVDQLEVAKAVEDHHHHLGGARDGRAKIRQRSIEVPRWRHDRSKHVGQAAILIIGEEGSRDHRTASYERVIRDHPGVALEA